MLTKYLWSIAQMGAEWVLYVLLFLSVASIALMFERAYYFYTIHIHLDKIQRSFRKALIQGGVDAAAQLFEKKAYPEAIILYESLKVAFRGPAGVEETIAGTRVKQKLQLEKRLAFLGTIGSNAPFIGLFGTVLGIIQAFGDLSGNQLQGASSKIMGSISEALVATAVGLLVAIPAVLAFNFFSSRAKLSLAQADTLTHDLLSFLRGLEKIEWAEEYSGLAKSRMSLAALPAFHHEQEAKIPSNDSSE